MSKLEKFLLSINLFIYFCLTIFSFSQLDLNLTISNNQLFLNFVGSMQQLGYYNRPISTAIFIALEVFAFSFFAFNLYLIHKGVVSLKYLLISSISIVSLLIFAYPFLSADIFNYLFDAKILLKYSSNPYTHRPLDFSQDEWLRFMRWTHRYSPYGPSWIFLSLIPSILGFGKFTLTLITFKIFTSIFHFINIYLIYKIIWRLNPKAAVFGTAFYALNPLILLEGVANGHNDIVQATFLLLPTLLVLNRKNSLFVLSIIIGTSIKYISVFTLPIVASAVSKRISIKLLIQITLVLILIFTVIYSTFGISIPFVKTGATQVQFQPWYLIWIIPLVAILTNPSLTTLATALCFGASLRYLPYLYYGDWSHTGTIPFMQLALLTPFFMAVVYFLTRKIFLKR